MTPPSMLIERDPTYREPQRRKKSHQSPIAAQEASQPFQNLPQEIIAEILIRLPVNSLLRFRSVCKLWLCLISSSNFVNSHLSLATETDYYTHQRIILHCLSPHFGLKSCSLNSILNDQSDMAVDLDYPLIGTHNWPQIVGSCNGLVCIAIQYSLFLWNPSTRRSNRLLKGAPMGFGCFIIFGFGYDDSNDDYKVVAILGVFGRGGSYETKVKVYSLRTGSWRRIGDFCYGIPYQLGKYVNGFLHWATWGVPGSSYSWDIVSLDLVTDIYGKVAQPNYGDARFDSTLLVLRGCLCVLCNIPKTRADIWVMKEYGKAESWTKLSIPYITYLRDYDYLSPLYISSNGEILLRFGQGIVLCNLKDGTFKKLEIQNLRDCLEAHTYVESLVSPNVGNMFQREHQ